MLGLTFKENVADLRNSQVLNIVRELREFGIFPLAHDPVANPQAAAALFGLTLSDIGDFRDLDGLVLAVPHQAYRVLPIAEIVAMLRPDGIVMDVKSVLNPDSLPPGISYWSL